THPHHAGEQFTPRLITERIHVRLRLPLQKAINAARIEVLTAGPQVTRQVAFRHGQESLVRLQQHRERQLTKEPKTKVSLPLDLAEQLVQPVVPLVEEIGGRHPPERTQTPTNLLTQRQPINTGHLSVENGMEPVEAADQVVSCLQAAVMAVRDLCDG